MNERGEGEWGGGGGEEGWRKGAEGGGGTGTNHVQVLTERSVPDNSRVRHL